MNKQTWSLLSILLLLPIAFLPIIRAQTTVPPDQIQAEILPTQGGANTTILIRFTTTNSSVGNVQTADIFWDNSTIALNEPGVLGANLAYNYNLTVPTEPSLSDVGNHTIRVDSTVVPFGPVSFFFAFNITTFIPSPEYIALNDTYNELLANYTNLNETYTTLFEDYNELMALHNNDTSNYLTLFADFNLLNTQYSSLALNYNILSTNFNNLTTADLSLSSSYTELLANYITLNDSFSNLAQDYNSLNTSYATLVSNYNSVVGQLDFSRNLNYALIIVTAALAISIVYFVIVRPKRSQKNR